MRNRLSRTVLAAAAVAAFAVPVGAQAKHGADDPAGHVRHAPHQTSAPATVTPAARGAKQRTASTSRSRHRHRHRHRHRGRHGRHHGRGDDRRRHRGRGRGSDDATAERRGRGSDDGPNHS
jgi:hypothetical protein